MMLPLLVGCAAFGDRVRVTTDTRDVSVPLLYCPAPLTPIRPILPIHTLTPAQLQSDGEIAKAYTASVLILLGYTAELEQILESYDVTSKAYDEIRRRYELEINTITNPQ